MALKNIIGLGFNMIGIGWSLADKSICKRLCEGSCSFSSDIKCSLLMLFVGIIIFVCGYAIIMVYKGESIKVVEKEFEREYRLKEPNKKRKK